MFTTITSLLIALSLLLGGTGAAVYASQDSQPGDMLYTVKITGEDFQFRLANQAETKVQLALKFAARRMNEAQAIAENGQQIQESLLRRLEMNLNSALQAAAEMEDAEGGLEKIKAEVMIHKRDCDRIQGNLPEDKDFGLYMLQDMFEQKLKVVDKGLEVPLAFQHAFRNRSGQEAEDELLGNVSDEEPLPEVPVEEEPNDEEPIEDTVPSKGPGYGEKNDTGESRGEGEQTQSTEVKGEAYGPGEPQAQPDEPLGPNDGTGYGSGEQYGNPDSGNPESGNPDSGNPDSGNPESGNPESGNPESGNPDSGNPDSGNPDSSNPDSGTGGSSDGQGGKP